MSYDELGRDFEDASEGHTFSNSTDYEMFYNRQCQNCLFDVDEDCSLLMVALLGRVPVHWTRGTDGLFTCSRRKVQDD